MIERIKYYERQLYKKRANKHIFSLANIDHPLVVDVLLKAIQSNAFSEVTCALLYDALLIQNDPKTYPAIVQEFTTTYRYHHHIIEKIYKIQDQRVVDILKNILEKPDDIPRLRNEHIIGACMQSLAKMRPQEAIPLLDTMIEKHPFSSEEKLYPAKRYGLSALTTLKNIDDPSARELVHKWESLLATHIKSHLKNKAFLKEEIRNLYMPPLIATHPALLQHLLAHLQSNTSKHHHNIIKFLDNSIKRGTVPDKLKAQILDTFCRLANQSEDKYLRKEIFKHLINHKDQRLLKLVLKTLDKLEFSSEAVQILSNLEYPGAVDAVILMIDDKESFPGNHYQYLHYLGVAGTAQAEDKLKAMLIARDTDSQFISHILDALAFIARHSDSAFETICLTLDHEDNLVRKNAIQALGKVGERAISILISLLQGTDAQIKEALKALSSEVFRDALPYIIPFLSPDKRYFNHLAYQALLTLQSEGAFSALNAYDESL